jgi:hypothetical protein
LRPRCGPRRSPMEQSPAKPCDLVVTHRSILWPAPCPGLGGRFRGLSGGGTAPAQRVGQLLRPRSTSRRVRRALLPVRMRTSESLLQDLPRPSSQMRGPGVNRQLPSISATPSGKSVCIASSDARHDCRVAIPRSGPARPPLDRSFVAGSGDLCERALSDTASRRAAVARDRPEIDAITHHSRFATAAH